jgi:hypothetical protein
MTKDLHCNLIAVQPLINMYVHHQGTLFIGGQFDVLYGGQESILFGNVNPCLLTRN